MTQVKGMREMSKLIQLPSVDVAVIGGGTATHAADGLATARGELGRTALCRD